MGAEILFYFLLIVSAVSAFPGHCTTPQGLTGTCTATTSCQHYVEIVARSSFSSIEDKKNVLLSWRCKRSGVCCPSETVYSEPPPSVERHKNLHLLPALKDCGETSSDKLFGANQTSPLDYPWMALISTETGGELEFTCGGTIINSRYILTAAHCVTQLGKSKLVGVRLGEYDIAEVKDCASEDLCADVVQDFSIEEAIPHPGYIGKRSSETLDLTNDIALIRLAEPIKELNNVLAVCLPFSEEMRNKNLENEHLIVTGWGRTNVDRDGEIVEKLDELSSKLLIATLPYVTNKKCAENFNSSDFGGIGFRQLCAGGQKGVSSCGGDSGGPLTLRGPFTFNGRKQIKVVQYGIVSAGVKTCGTEGRPSVFTGVAHYMDWILDQLKP